MNFRKDMVQTIGNTPLVELNQYRQAGGIGAMLWAKCEFLNPGGSLKDRAALYMIREAERTGKLKPGRAIIEPTSGNTGIALAMIAATKGYPLILTMPESMSVERRTLLKALGARLVLTPPEKGMQGAIRKAEELLWENPGGFIPQQFSNPANPEAHYETTGPEIWHDLEGGVDIFVAGVGTGGTITGVGRFLKEQDPGIRIVAVEPAGSPVLSGGSPGFHRLQGLGAGFVPSVLDRSVVDEVMPIGDEEAFRETRQLAFREGMLTGISSGAVLAAAGKLAARRENAGKHIVVLLGDTGERYLSTTLFQD